MASDLRRWQVHTLTDHLPISFQARLFITGNKQDVVRGFQIQGGLGRRNCNIPVLGSYLFLAVGGYLLWVGGLLLLPETQRPGCLHLSPGGNL